MKRRVPSKGGVQRWRVTQIGRSRAREIAELQAKTADEAIKRAIRKLGITEPERQKRLAAYRVA